MEEIAELNYILIKFEINILSIMSISLYAR